MTLDSVMVTMQLAIMGYPEEPFKIRVDEKTGVLGYDPHSSARGYVESGATSLGRFWAGAGRHQIRFVYPCISDYTKMYDLTQEPYRTIALRAQEALLLMQQAYTEDMTKDQQQGNDEWQKLDRSIVLIRDACKGEMKHSSDLSEKVLKWDQEEHRMGAEVLSFAKHRIQVQKVKDYVYSALVAMNDLMGKRPGIEETMAQLSNEKHDEKHNFLKTSSSSKKVESLKSPPKDQLFPVRPATYASKFGSLLVEPEKKLLEEKSSS